MGEGAGEGRRHSRGARSGWGGGGRRHSDCRFWCLINQRYMMLKSRLVKSIGTSRGCSRGGLDAHHETDTKRRGPLSELSVMHPKHKEVGD